VQKPLERRKMSFKIITGDITKCETTAIVNAANTSLLGGGGVDGAIHRRAGPALLAECRALHGCKTGSAKITKGYSLPAKYVLHTPGPVWHGGGHGEEAMLASCYRSCLELAAEHGLKSVAFCCVSTGEVHFPHKDAAEIAVGAVKAFLETRSPVKRVIFNVFQDLDAKIYRGLL